MLIHRRGPKSHPKAKCHGCGKCFRPSRERERTRYFATCWRPHSQTYRYATIRRNRAAILWKYR